jgi:hypothetical protein
MHSFSIAQLFSLGLLVIAPLASAYVDVAGTVDLTNKRSFVVSDIVHVCPRPRTNINRVDISLVLLFLWRPDITLRLKCKNPDDDI